jgi:uncharacterized membrane protein HdeD (DUF308 family)
MRSSTILLGLGALLLIGGVIAVVNPFAAALTATTLVGCFLLFSGAAQLWLAIAYPLLAHRFWTGLIAVLALIAGTSLLVHPLQGVISLTILLGVLLLIMGLARLAVAFVLRQTGHFWLLLLSGAASALIGALVLANIHAAATTFLGLLLGIQLLADGIALVTLGLFARGTD